MTQPEVDPNPAGRSAGPARPARVAAALGALAGLTVAASFASTGWHVLGKSFSDPDDAMRMVQVRDWLGGQGWFDLAQHRMQAPEGVPMHWSRVDDLPVASVIALFSPIFGPSFAEKLAMLFWPIALIPVLFAAVCATACAKDLRRTGTAIVALLSSALLSRFTAGRIDHHALMTTLACCASLTLLWPSSLLLSVAAGVATALCLAVGLEDLVSLAALAGGVAILWLIQGRPERQRAIGFGIGVGGGGLIFAFAFAPASAWTSTACDALSMGWIVALITGGFSVSGAATMASDSLRSRIFWLAPGASVTASAIASSTSVCLNGLFLLDPDVNRYWLDRVTEMTSILKFSGGDATILAEGAAVPCLALAILAHSAYRRRMSGPEAAYAFVLLAATVLGFRFVRSSGLPIALGAPIVARRLSEMDLEIPRGLALRAIAVIASLPALFSLIEYTGIRGADAASEARLRCVTSSSWSSVAALPRGRIASPIDLGAIGLYATEHEMLAGGYHRARQGLLDTVHIMTGTEPEAKNTLARRKIDYVVWCDGMRELNWAASLNPEGLAAHLKDGRLPSWLSKIDLPGPVRAARVVASELSETP